MRSTENEWAGEPVAAGYDGPGAVPVPGGVPGVAPGAAVPEAGPGPGPDDSPTGSSARAEAPANGARDVLGDRAGDADGWGAEAAEPVPAKVPTGVNAGAVPAGEPDQAPELAPVLVVEGSGAVVSPDPGAAAVVAGPVEGVPAGHDPDLGLDPEPEAEVRPELQPELQPDLRPGTVPDPVFGVSAPMSRSAGVNGAVLAAGAPGEWDRMGDGGSRPGWWDSAPAPEGTAGSGDPGAWWGAGGRRHSVIANETTAPIPVHLLFRDDDKHESHDSQLTSTSTSTGTGTGLGAGAGVAVRRPGVRRPPVPRSPQEHVPTRPAPLADPRLAERPGPVLPGWTALLTAAAGTGAGLALLWWTGALPAEVAGRLGIGARPYDGIGTGTWALLALLATVVLFALCGLGRGRVGYASVLTLFGEYRGTARRTGLIWVSPLLLRRRVDVRLRHWRSEPLPAVDASGTSLRVVVLVVWRIKDTVRATLGVADHEQYLRDQVEAALARVLSQLPADAFHEETRTLRDAETVGDALTRMLKADCVPVGIEVYSAQPTGIEYAPEVAAAMQRCRVAAIDAKHRDGVLTSVVDAVDDTVRRLTSRGIVELDAYEHKALVRDLTVAFYTGRSGGEGA
ncbi:SPFH domain-containing protein [Streptomyces sp. NBC_00683]|uniref:SPFH domain-containing protein n=1 Tax=Streptomyces sp. NBC_00683 TaxID=2903670 RepID=UPI002E3798E9|nr:SPFH domain-containing protein [Streptomyces sp. NBC_00683]